MERKGKKKRSASENGEWIVGCAAAGDENGLRQLGNNGHGSDSFRRVAKEEAGHLVKNAFSCCALLEMCNFSIGEMKVQIVMEDCGHR